MIRNWLAWTLVPLMLFPLFLTHPSISLADEGRNTRIVELLERLSPSVGALYAHDAGGNMQFLCSVTAIGRENSKEVGPKGQVGDLKSDSTVILTAQHCLRKGVAYLVNFGDGVLRSVQPWKVPHYELPDNEREFGEPKTDMALFLMSGTDVPTVDLGDTDTLKAGRRLVTVGFPLGVAKITYEGILAGRFDRPGADQHGYLLMQIFGAPGSSGSAVVDVRSGKVVGVLVSAKQARAGLPVIFGTPIEYRKHLEVVSDTP